MLSKQMESPESRALKEAMKLREQLRYKEQTRFFYNTNHTLTKEE